MPDIIGEIGGNHNSDSGRLEELINAAFDAGLDGVNCFWRMILVQIQSSAPYLDGVTERRAPLRGGARLS